MSVIKFKNVTKYYTKSKAGSPAVNNISLDIESGNFVVLLGSSGCGKTTLLKMVNRLYEPTDGSIYINGKDSREFSVNDLRRKIGYVIQQSGLFPHMTVEKNVATVPEMLGWDKDRLDKRIDELLNLIHMDPTVFRKRYPSQLSGGQKQRVGLARALAADPPFMLMDEPFGAIDAITRTSLQNELISLQKKLNKTILFVTHDVDEALRLADKIVIMNEGKVIQYDTPLNIMAKPKNEFVKGLIGGEDVMRQMSLITVSHIMEDTRYSSVQDEVNTVSEDTDLKSVVSLLLQSSEEEIYVTNEDGKIIGKITLSLIKDLLSSKVRDVYEDGNGEKNVASI